MRTTKQLRTLTVGLALALSVTACGGGDSEAPDTAAPGGGGGGTSADPELAELISAAKEENCLTLYGAPDEAALKAVTDAFKDEYGITASFTRLVSGDLTQRFSSEAEAGAPASDVILLTHSPFYETALEKGWLEPMTEQSVPSLGDLPEDFVVNDGATPIVQLVPSGIVFNTDRAKTPPKEWEDYADLAMKGELLFAEPNASPANLSFWQLMRDTYGDDFVKQVGANEPRFYNSAVPATQAVAAGEGAVGFPGVQAIVKTLQKANAPVDIVFPTPTTGPLIAMGLTAESKCPNAAKLFADFLLSEEGNQVLADASGDLSPYAEEAAEFKRPEPVSKEDAATINSLLGAG